MPFSAFQISYETFLPWTGISCCTSSAPDVNETWRRCVSALRWRGADKEKHETKNRTRLKTFTSSYKGTKWNKKSKSEHKHGLIADGAVSYR